MERKRKLIILLIIATLLLTGPAMAASFGKIAFASDRDGNYEIYVMDANGANPTRLTINDSYDTAPAWSPDGTKIAFSSERDGGYYEIYVMDANGANPTRLTVSDGYEQDAAWSPDGTKIAFMAYREWNEDIYVMDANGANPTRLTTSTAHDYDPSWSPDGTKIAFASDRDGNFEIYVMDANGANPIRLTMNAIDDANPAWSPDGTQIVFTSWRDGGEEIYVMDASGANPTRLTINDDRDTYPAWWAGIPMADAGPDIKAWVNEYVAFDASGSTDVDGYIVSYHWDFGDGYTSSAVAPSHSYPASGDYTVYLKVTDNDGLTDGDTIMVIVRTPAEATHSLSDTVDSLGLPSGIETAMMDKLAVAEMLMYQGKYIPAKQTLLAFINQVNSQIGKTLTQEQADDLIAEANRILAEIS